MPQMAMVENLIVLKTSVFEMVAGSIEPLAAF
jgi:hypothetical protein